LQASVGQLPICSISPRGPATKPTRRQGDRILENNPTYRICPDASLLANGSSG
jgi:hypothetical protein